MKTFMIIVLLLTMFGIFSMVFGAASEKSSPILQKIDERAKVFESKPTCFVNLFLFPFALLIET